ncbi:MAG: hypothetical protein PVJ44_20720 [Desulfobacterales bacterium]
MRNFFEDAFLPKTDSDVYSLIGFSKLNTSKIALIAAATINDLALPFFKQHDMQHLRVLTDRGT